LIALPIKEVFNNNLRSLEKQRKTIWNHSKKHPKIASTKKIRYSNKNFGINSFKQLLNTLEFHTAQNPGSKVKNILTLLFTWIAVH
jgi:hypothetical protein